MNGEFEKQLNTLKMDTTTKAKILQIIHSAGDDFPCLSCPSIDECNNFKWFTKWFGTENAPQ
jgi:hypothetical protein